MRFIDYIGKLLDDESFKKEWNKKDDEQKRNYIEIMNKLIEIVSNNIKPIIYKTNYEGWSKLWDYMEKNYKVMCLEKIGNHKMGYTIQYYINDKNEAMFALGEYDNYFIYLEYKENKLDFIFSKDKFNPSEKKAYYFSTKCEFAYNQNNDLVILTRNDGIDLYYCLVFGKSDIKEIDAIKKIDFNTALNNDYLDMIFYMKWPAVDLYKIGEAILESLIKKDIDSIEKNFTKDISYTDINTYGFYNKSLSFIFSIILNSKEIIKSWVEKSAKGVYFMIQIREKDNRIRNVIYSLEFDRNLFVKNVARLEPWLFDNKEYEEMK